MALLLALAQEKSLEAHACLFVDMVVLLKDAQELTRRVLSHGWPCKPSGARPAPPIKLVAFQGAADLMRLSKDDDPPRVAPASSSSSTAASAPTTVTTEATCIDLQSPFSVLHLLSAALQAIGRVLVASSQSVASLPAFNQLGGALAAQVELLADPRLYRMCTSGQQGGADGEDGAALLQALQHRTIVGLDRYLACRHLPPESTLTEVVVSILGFVEHQAQTSPADASGGRAALPCKPADLVLLLRNLVHLMGPDTASRPFISAMFPQAVTPLLKALTTSLSGAKQPDGSLVEAEKGSQHRALRRVLFWALRRIMVEWPSSAWHIALIRKLEESDGEVAAQVALCHLMAVCKHPEIAQEVVRGWVRGGSLPRKRSLEEADLEAEGGRGTKAKQARSSRHQPDDMEVDADEGGVNEGAQAGALVADKPPTAATALAPPMRGEGGALAVVLRGVLDALPASASELKRLSQAKALPGQADQWMQQVAEAAASAALGLQLLAFTLSTVQPTSSQATPPWYEMTMSKLVEGAAKVLDAFPLDRLEALVHTAMPHQLLNLALACMHLVPLHAPEVEVPQPIRGMLGHLGVTAMECLCRKQFLGALLPELNDRSADLACDVTEANEARLMADALRLSVLEKLLLLACCGGPLTVSGPHSGFKLESLPACLWTFMPEAVHTAVRELLIAVPALGQVLMLLLSEATPRPVLLLLLHHFPILLETLLCDVPEQQRNVAAIATLCLAAGRQLLNTAKDDKEVVTQACKGMHECISAAFYHGVQAKGRPRIRCMYVEPALGASGEEGEASGKKVDELAAKLPPRHLEALVVMAMGFASQLSPGNPAHVRVGTAKLVMGVVSFVPRAALLSEAARGVAATVPKVLLNFLRDADASVREFMAGQLDCFIHKKAALAQLMLAPGSNSKSETQVFEEAISLVNHELEEMRQTLEAKLETSANAPQLYIDFLRAQGTLAMCCPNEPAYEPFFLWVVINLVRIWSKMNICCSVAFEQLHRISRHSRFNLEESLARHAESCFLPLYQTLLGANLLEAFVGEVLAECHSMDAFLECSLKFVITGATLKQDLPFLEKVAVVWDRYLGPDSSKNQVSDYAEEVRKHTPLWGMLVGHASPVVARLFLVDFSAVGWYYKQIPGHTPTGTKLQGMFCEVVWEMAEAECSHNHSRRAAALAALKALAALTEMKERGDDPLEGMTQVDGWSHDSDVASYVENNFLYALSKVVLTIDWRRRPVHINLVAMTLLRQLLELMPRPRLSTIFPKVMVVMNVMLEEGAVGVDGHGGGPEVFARACETLATFVRMLSDEDLLANMAVIVVTLIPAISSEDASPGGASTAASSDPSGPWARSRRILLDLLHWLIVTKRSSLSEAFVGIPFLPSLPELKEAHDVLSRSVPSNSQLPVQLKRLIPLLSHDSAPVRLQTLKQLHRVLKAGRGHLFDLVAGSDVAEDVVSELLTALLRLRMDSDPAHRLTCCACLGELGAIDPARVSVNLYSRGEGGSQGATPALVAPWTITDSRLALVVLSDMLVPTIRAATKDHDRFPFAIQELLKLLYKRGGSRLVEGGMALPPGNESTQIETDEKERRNKPMPHWLQEALSDVAVLGVVNPFWSTNYVVHKQGLPSKPPFLVGGSSGQSFRNRLGTLCLYLIDVSRGPFYELFYACRGIVRPHEGLKNFLLPYLVCDAWCFGDAHIKDVLLAEIMSVLAPTQGANDQAKGASDPVAIQAMLSLIDTLMDWATAKRVVVTSTEGGRRRGAAAQQQVDLTTSSDGLWSPKSDDVRALLKLIPRPLLVKASLRIRAYTRALKYLEEHVRETRHNNPQDLPGHLGIMTGDSLPPPTPSAPEPLPTISQLSVGNDGANNTLPMLESSEVDLFQLIFSRLDEPDSMCGLAAVRRKAGKPKTLRQRIREYEHDEDWSSALQGYEQAMLALDSEGAAGGSAPSVPLMTDATQDPRADSTQDVNAGPSSSKGARERKAEVAKGMLQSLIELDQVDSALNLFMAMVSRDGDLRQPLLPAGIEACWRLQRWPTLRDLGGEAFEARFDDPDERFQVALGRVVLSLQDRDECSMAAALKHARNEAMASLAAASMESYQRAYPSLVKLHIVHELEQGHELLVRHKDEKDSDEDRVKRLLDEWGWDNRLTLMRTSARQSAPVLAARRAIFQMAGLKGHIAEAWLTQAARATDAGCFRLAESALRQAACWPQCGERVTLQEAKLLQAQDRVHDALLLLEPVEVDVGLLRARMTDVVKSASGHVADTHREQAATRLLLTTNWMVEARVKHGQQVLDRYNLTTTLLPKSEACYFSLASYYDFLLDARGKELKDVGERAADVLYQTYLRCTIESYATSLHNGLEHIFTSMPRLLTLCGMVQSMVSGGAGGGSSWSGRSTSSGRAQSPVVKTQQDCHSHVNKAVVSVPSYAWYTCLPQLLSQLGSSIPTSNGDLRSLILDAVIKVLSSHPDQAVWSITGLTQSKDTDRKRLGDRVRHLILYINTGSLCTVNISDPRFCACVDGVPDPDVGVHQAARAVDGPAGQDAGAVQGPLPRAHPAGPGRRPPGECQPGAPRVGRQDLDRQALRPALLPRAPAGRAHCEPAPAPA